MNVAVLGLWHLGSVTAACAASAGHRVIGWDPDRSTLEGLKDGRAPIGEPGLDALIAAGLASGRLDFTSSLRDAVVGADLVWLTFDTPVDDEDRADVEYVLRHAEAALPHVTDGAVVLSSSQLPVGSVARLERAFAESAAGRHVSFACSPENLRLGKAIDVFTNPDRVIVGVRDDRTARVVAELFAPITNRLERMSVESAEMTKHAINAFLATSVTFINEIAALCERTGADAKEVERGLKTEKRIGPHAYLGPGTAFAGGTLARDVVFLRALGRSLERATPVMDGVEASNLEHRNWARRRLESTLAPLAGRTIAVWGLTYKPGTDTLRRSTAVELCRWLLRQGVHVQAHDPAAGALPADLVSVSRSTTALEGAAGADALVIATEWPEYRDVDLDALAATLKGHVVVDGNRFLGGTVGRDARFTLVSVGAPDARLSAAPLRR
jgi:UDPglucose 6-dehydrogenase